MRARDAGGASSHASSLRTRIFVVIVVAMVIPSLLLAALATYAYYRSWDTASVLYTDQAAYNARGLADDVDSLRAVPGGLADDQKQKMTTAIVRSFGAGNRGGAWWSTMAAVEEQQVLPRWAIRSLKRDGYALGAMDGKPMTGRMPDIVAWRVGEQDVRYFTTSQFTTPAAFDVPLHQAPLGRLFAVAATGAAIVIVLGILGAMLLSRGVVRPVRRVAEASQRLAAGDTGEPVRPSGPRELRELAESFNDMSAQLTKAQEAEQSFLLSVSHELKTPLTSIRGYAEGLDDGALPAKEAARVIGGESARLERLVGDLLDSARMRKRAFSVRREIVDLSESAKEAVNRYESTARDAGLALNLKTEPGTAVVADQDRVLQVVSNLVENAIRCTPPPGTVTVSAGPGAVSVADTGPGLTPEDTGRAFERFYLYDRYGKDRPVGTGLGLAIVKELTEAMGGSVTISSAVGVGSAFIVSLPMANGEALSGALSGDVRLTDDPRGAVAAPYEADAGREPAGAQDEGAGAAQAPVDGAEPATGAAPFPTDAEETRIGGDSAVSASDPSRSDDAS